MQIMPFDEAKTYRFNPFDLTKVWPHGDYPLVDVGTLTLNRNVTDYHTEMEQAAFQPNNMVPGTGLSPDKMLLARGFSYADAHRARLGVNYQQIPVNRPKAPVHNYSKDGAMRVDNVADPVYYPNSFEDAPAADEHTYAEQAVWAADGEMVRAAYTLHAEDDDFGQANTLINDVMDDARARAPRRHRVGPPGRVCAARRCSSGPSSTGGPSTRKLVTWSRRPRWRDGASLRRPDAPRHSSMPCFGPARIVSRCLPLNSWSQEPRSDFERAMSWSRDWAVSQSIDRLTWPSRSSWCNPAAQSVRAPHRLHTGMRPFVSGRWCWSS